MHVERRRTMIVDFLRNQGFASLQELVAATEASESTVRRDLEHFERLGQLRRTRGGAAYVGESLTDLPTRAARGSEEKQAIARHVCQLLNEGESVLLDGGTTTLEVARELDRLSRPMQVVTNSLPIAQVLIDSPLIELVMIGGYVYPKTGVALGPLTTAALKDLRVRKLVLSVGGITKDGLFNSNSLLVEAERMMIDSAEQVILAANHQKFGHVELARLCDWSAIDDVVHDNRLSDDWKAFLNEQNIQTHQA